MAYISTHFYSKYLAHDTQITLALPDDPDLIPEDGLPLLYLLHGRGDDATSWLRKSSIEEYVCRYGLAAVMPSAECSFYTDGIYGKRYFSYMTKELPRLVRAWFPVTGDAGRTYIAGLSMGGYGALRIGLSCPEAFSVIGIMSAGIRPDQIPDYEETDTGNRILREDIRAAFGEGSLKREDIPRDMILDRIREGRKIPGILHYEGKQDMLYEMNQDFRNFALENRLDYAYEEWDGLHDWTFWDRALEKLLSQIERRK